ncbi:cytochrome P450 [Winogradskyella eckloniae]|uniref:cytochrome P450 n=1 Tax=Winogradskyella eckloniae TaxID=1089306 RepID=UPI0015635214|nr:cytochrome P450 [Winogradskyella eckloniae]NRD18969.1 cytochrome P450 [Winogradskyella eckloniae]
MNKEQNIPSVSLRKFLKHSLEILKNPLPFHHQNFVEQGDVFRLKIGFSSSVIFIRDASLAEYVLQKNQKNYTKSKIQTEDLVKYVGKGLLTSEGDHWKKQRKLIQPAFHKKQLSNLLDNIKEAIQTEYKRITPDTVIDIFPILNDLAFQTVVKSLFSIAVNQQDISDLQNITEQTQNMLVKELRQPYLGWWFSLSGEIKKHTDLTNKSRAILKRIVNERRVSQTKEHDLLDMLLEAKYDDGSPMAEQQLIDEILILFAAGHETTSNALTFATQLLALHPEWQDKIYNERKTIEDESDDLMDVVTKSKICQQVIEEAMRLYPPAYFIDRVNKAPDAFNDMEFEAGSNLLFSVYEMHRNPKLWEQPDAFLPERFSEGSRKFSSQYFPFGAGPRKCIGNNFAMFEMVIAISELVYNYKIIPDFETIEITPLITLKPKNAFLKFEARV